jgi:hypothetical protein
MRRKPSLPNRLRTTARWPLGIALTSWAYMWRTTPIYRRELDGSWPTDGPPAIDAPASAQDFQRPEDGAGPLFRRRYRASIADTATTPAALMSELKADPNRVAPGALAHFQKTVGDEGALRVGDEFLVRMPGPWDGPVRVVDETPTSFRFATLDGHLEAGQIEWRARGEGDALVVEIESWARGGDQLSYILHDRLKMAKEVQLHMWTSVLERVVRRSGGRLDGGIDVKTRRVELDAGPRGVVPEPLQRKVEP